MADTENPAARLLDELAALDPYQRHEVAKHLRKVAENVAEVPDGWGFSPACSTPTDSQTACSEIGRLRDVPGSSRSDTGETVSRTVAS